jgi:alanyl aminopeptidase
MTLVVPEKHLVLCNSPVEKETTQAGQRTVVFRKTPPLPSYLLAIAAGPLETVDIPNLGVPGRVVTVAGQSNLAGLAVEATPPLLKALEKWFDQKYPFEKLDLIAIPEYWYGAMENPGAITFSANLLLIDPKAPARPRSDRWRASPPMSWPTCGSATT